MKKYYLAYGSNLNLDQMLKRCPTMKVAGRAVLPGYNLAFRCHGGSGSYLTVLPGHPGDSVDLGVYEIEPRDEASLDRYEGWPKLYRKETISVEMENLVTGERSQIEGLIYIMNDQFIRRPERWYVDTVLAGFEDWGFNPEPVIEAVLSAEDPGGRDGQ